MIFSWSFDSAETTRLLMRDLPTVSNSASSDAKTNNALLTLSAASQVDDLDPDLLRSGLYSSGNAVVNQHPTSVHKLPNSYSGTKLNSSSFSAGSCGGPFSSSRQHFSSYPHQQQNHNQSSSEQSPAILSGSGSALTGSTPVARSILQAVKNKAKRVSIPYTPASAAVVQSGSSGQIDQHPLGGQEGEPPEGSFVNGHADYDELLRAAKQSPKTPLQRRKFHLDLRFGSSSNSSALGKITAGSGVSEPAVIVSHQPPSSRFSGSGGQGASNPKQNSAPPSTHQKVLAKVQSKERIPISQLRESLTAAPSTGFNHRSSVCVGNVTLSTASTSTSTSGSGVGAISSDLYNSTNQGIVGRVGKSVLSNQQQSRSSADQSGASVNQANLNISKLQKEASTAAAADNDEHRLIAFCSALLQVSPMESKSEVIAVQPPAAILASGFSSSNFSQQKSMTTGLSDCVKTGPTIISYSSTIPTYSASSSISGFTGSTSINSNSISNNYIASSMMSSSTTNHQPSFVYANDGDDNSQSATFQLSSSSTSEQLSMANFPPPPPIPAKPYFRPAFEDESIKEEDGTPILEEVDESHYASPRPSTSADGGPAAAPRRSFSSSPVKQICVKNSLSPAQLRSAKAQQDADQNSCSQNQMYSSKFLHQPNPPEPPLSSHRIRNRLCTSYRIDIPTLKNPVDACLLPNQYLAIADYDNGIFILNQFGDIIEHKCGAEDSNACGIACIGRASDSVKLFVLVFREGLWTINIYENYHLAESIRCPTDAQIENWALRKIGIASPTSLHLMASGEAKVTIWLYEFESRSWRVLATENSRKGGYNDVSVRLEQDLNELHVLLTDWRKSQLCTVVFSIDKMELIDQRSIRVKRVKGQEWIVQGPNLALLDEQADIIVYDGSGKLFLFDGDTHKCKKIIADVGRGEVSAVFVRNGWVYVLCRYRLCVDVFLYKEFLETVL